MKGRSEDILRNSYKLRNNQVEDLDSGKRELYNVLGDNLFMLSFLTVECDGILVSTKRLDL